MLANSMPAKLFGEVPLTVCRIWGPTVELRAVRASLGSKDRISSLQRLASASPYFGLLEEDIFSTDVAYESNIA